MQAGPKMDSEKAIAYGTSSMRFAMDVLYGVAPLQATAGTSALIFKDNN